MPLSRSAILAAVDSETEAVDVPEWGDKVYVRSLTGKELDDYTNGLRKQVGNQTVMQPNQHAKLLVRALVDENGVRLFTDRDVEELGKKNAKVLDRLWDVAARLSGLTDEEQEAIEGNSGGALSADSSSGSPETSA